MCSVSVGNERTCQVSGDRHVLRSPGCTRRARRTVCDRRLAESNTDLVKATQIRVGQIGVPLTDVVDRLVHPVPLIFFFGLQDAAAMYVAEQLVTGSIE